jgi:hypothetical protein
MASSVTNASVSSATSSATEPSTAQVWQVVGYPSSVKYAGAAEEAVPSTGPGAYPDGSTLEYDADDNVQGINPVVSSGGGFQDVGSFLSAPAIPWTNSQNENPFSYGSGPLDVLPYEIDTGGPYTVGNPRSQFGHSHDDRINYRESFNNYSFAFDPVTGQRVTTGNSQFGEYNQNFYDSGRGTPPMTTYSESPLYHRVADSAVAKTNFDSAWSPSGLLPSHQPLTSDSAYAFEAPGEPLVNEVQASTSNVNVAAGPSTRWVLS